MQRTAFFSVLAVLMAACTGNSQVADAAGAMDSDSVCLADTCFEEGEPTGEEEGLRPYEQVWVDADELPEKAEWMDKFLRLSVYVNVEHEPSEQEPVGTYSVWLVQETVGEALRVCVTNPTAQAQWELMQGRKADAVDVPMHLIATAQKAYVVPCDMGKVIVEGCPDGRNVWTYIIDYENQTAMQFPSTEGVVEIDNEAEEVVLSSYGYDDDGRYSYTCAYGLDGRFHRVVTEKVRE